MPLLLLVHVLTARGADFYADPVHGDAAGDGSRAHPWGSLEELIAAEAFETLDWDGRPYTEGVSTLVPHTTGPIGPGDTLWLLAGHHGTALFDSLYVDGTITVAALPGARATLARARFRAASGWVLRGVAISPAYGDEPSALPLVEIDTHAWGGPASDITVEDCELETAADTTSWSAEDWDTRAADGVRAEGDDIVVRGNHLRNVAFGITTTGARALVEGNLIERFSGDGLRGLGDQSVFAYNTVRDLFLVNDNHPDGFQSWSVGADGRVGTGEVTGTTLRGNVFVNTTDPGRPHQGNLQGIGMFDGTYVDWRIENNVVVTDHWHGITLMGARGARIVNNTVVDLFPDNEVGPPWIRVTAHKNGTPAQDCRVWNNLATAYASDTAGVTEDHDLRVLNLDSYFVHWPDDLRLVAGSPAIDAGDPDGAPATDADGIARPQGSGVDVGAYEYVTPVPEDTGGSDTATLDDTGEEPVDTAEADPDSGEDTAPAEVSPAPDTGAAADDAGCSCATTVPRPLPGFTLALAGLFAWRGRRAPGAARRAPVSDRSPRGGASGDG
jgi:hypothetical protein